MLTRVHHDGPTSRAVLTKALGLNRSTIGALTTELVELGLVTEGHATVAGRAGRPSLMVVPRSDVAVMAVDIGVDRLTAALVGLGGDELDRLSRQHQRGEHDLDHVVEAVGQMVDELRKTHPDVQCLGVGVAVPGTVRTLDGFVRFAPNLGWRDAPFAERLSDRVRLPVRAANDANLGVLSEHARGAAVGFDNVAYLSGSVGIGGGFLVDGEPLTGASGYAGEVGHLLVDSNGPECRCGSVGCWEMKVGETQLLVAAGRLPGGGPAGVAEVITAARSGETRASEALTSVAHWTGVGLRAIVNVFNPDVIVLGGSLAQIWDAAQDVVARSLGYTPLIAEREPVAIRAARLGQDSPLSGAAELAFAGLLANPQAGVD